MLFTPQRDKNMQCFLMVLNSTTNTKTNKDHGVESNLTLHASKKTKTPNGFLRFVDLKAVEKSKTIDKHCVFCLFCD